MLFACVVWVVAVWLVVSHVCCRMCTRSVLAGRCRGPMGAGGLELAGKVQWELGDGWAKVVLSLRLQISESLAEV